MSCLLCAHVYIQTHIFTHTHMHTHMHTHAYTHKHVHIFTHTYAHTCVHTQTCTHIHTHKHVHMHTHKHVHMHTHKHVHKHAYFFMLFVIFVSIHSHPQALQLICALSTLLELSPQEVDHIKRYLEYKVCMYSCGCCVELKPYNHVCHCTLPSAVPSDHTFLVLFHLTTPSPMLFHLTTPSPMLFHLTTPSSCCSI